MTDGMRVNLLGAKQIGRLEELSVDVNRLGVLPPLLKGLPYHLL